MPSPGIKEDRPSYVRFEKRPVESRPLSLANGHYSTIDIDFAIITPHGTTDEIPRVVKDWFEYLDQSVREERTPQKFVDYYKDCYQHYLKGEEVPLVGTPIRDWPPIGPTQRAGLLTARIYTVEDLANANESAIGMLGMGGRELQQKAANWLKSATEVGKITEEISTLQVTNKRLETVVTHQQETIKKMREELNTMLEQQIRPSPIEGKVE